VSEFQIIIDHSGIVELNVAGALARLQLARAKGLSGDREAARRLNQNSLALWKDSDPDIPIFKQVKTGYARLK
jgi:hypothetical protein